VQIGEEKNVQTILTSFSIQRGANISFAARALKAYDKGETQYPHCNQMGI